MEAFLSRIKATPVIGPVVAWSEQHPRLAAWIVLAAGMVIILAVEARDVGLEVGQWIALMVATVLVAGLCIWIVSWEDGDEFEAGGEGQPPAVEDNAKPAEDTADSPKADAPPAETE